MKRRLSLAFILGLIALASSCSLGKGKELGEGGVVQFHNQFNALQYKQIYAGASEAFRKSATEADVIALFETLHTKLGNMKQSTQSGWQVNSTDVGTTVSLDYSTDFAEGNGTEKFVFLVTGEKASLFNYNVNSPLLVAAQ